VEENKDVSVKDVEGEDVGLEVVYDLFLELEG